MTNAADDADREGEPPQAQHAISIAIELPPEAEAGVYADFATIWWTPETFVLDFAVTKQPPAMVSNGDGGEASVVLPAKVVARVRIPASQAIEVAKALAQQLDRWEEATGHRPPYEGPPLPGTGD